MQLQIGASIKAWLPPNGDPSVGKLHPPAVLVIIDLTSALPWASTRVNRMMSAGTVHATEAAAYEANCYQMRGGTP